MMRREQERSGCFLLGSQALHQAAFAPGSIILVNHALLSGLVQDADRHAGRLDGVFFLTFFDSQTGLLHRGAGVPDEKSIAQAPLLVLFIALDLRLDISQLTPTK